MSNTNNMTPQQYTIHRNNNRLARQYFGIENNLNMVLHHKDENLLYTDIERYIQWNPEDLIVMTTEEHTKLHHTGLKWSDESRAKIQGCKNGANTHPEKNNFINNNPAKKIKGTQWFNNGIEQVRALECPEGFKKGMLKI